MPCILCRGVGWGVYVGEWDGELREAGWKHE